MNNIVSESLTSTSIFYKVGFKLFSIMMSILKDDFMHLCLTRFFMKHIKVAQCYFRKGRRIKIQIQFKDTFLSEGTDAFVISPNRRTFYFPELENLNFGDF